MSDPTFVPHWNESDPRLMIRQQRTEIEVLASFRRLSAASGETKLKRGPIVEATISELTKRYKYTPTPEFVEDRIAHLISKREILEGTSLIH